MFHVEHLWNRILDRLLDFLTKEPAVKLPPVVLPPDPDDVPRETKE